MTAPPRRPILLACQTTLAAATVAVMTVPALSVVQLDIVPAVPSVPTARSLPSAPSATMPRPGKEGPAGTAAVSTAPVTPKVEEVELDAAEVRAPTPRHRAPASRGTVLTKAIPVTGYATVGVNWAGSNAPLTEEQISLELRTLARGTWTPWEEMHYDPDHEPDPGSSDAETGARPGTDAVVIGEVDKVQVRIRMASGPTPEDVELTVIDPGVEGDMELQAPQHGSVTSDTAGSRPEAAGSRPEAAVLTAAGPARPTIFSRAQWGANESLRDGSPRYGEIHAGFVHHTVNANGYSREQVPSIIRGIYAYHTQGRGWSDVGYNFLVDRFGRIWEGRYGGVARPVIGAHTLGYNEYSFAMSAIGNFDTTGPPQAMLDAYARLFAWKLSLHGVKAASTRQRVGRSYFQAISGHRDAGQTACPGRYLYAKLPAIRTAAARIQNGATPTPPPPPPPSPASGPVTDLSGSSWPDIAARRGRDGRLTVTRTEGQLKFQPAATAATGWGGRDLAAATGDVNRDGRGDLIARDPAAKRATLYPGNGTGGFGAPVRHFTRFNGLDQLVGAGDVDRDGRADLVGRMARTRELRLYPGLGNGDFGRARSLAASWDYDLTVGAGDLDGDRQPDLLGRRNGKMYFLKGLRTRMAAPVELPGAWSGYDVVTGRGDLTGDRRADVVVRDAGTKLAYILAGDGAGGFHGRYGPFTAFRDLRWFGVGGNLKTGPGIDAVGISGSTGALRVVGNTGRRNLGATVDTGVSLPAVDAVLAVGDWNRDGRGDVMYRERGSDRLMFLAGKGGDAYAAPVVAGSGFGGVSGLVAAGDVTGDGRPDLLGEDAGGAVRVYAGNGGSGFGAGFAARSGAAAPAGKHRGVVHRRADGSVWLWRLSADGGPLTGTRIAGNGNFYDWYLFLGDVDGNGSPDVLARARATGLLWLLPVSGDRFGQRRYVGHELVGHGLAG